VGVPEEVVGRGPGAAPDATAEAGESGPGPFGPRYALLRRIGGGGIGSVHLAYDHELERFVAIKRVRPDRLSPAAVQLFLDEARAASRLRHGAIVTVFEILREPAASPPAAAAGAGAPAAPGTTLPAANGAAIDGVALVLELVDGETLRSRIRRDGPLDPVTAVRLLAEVGRALAYAHAQGVVHRDVKPGNLLVAGHGRPKLLDFGVAHVDGGLGPFQPGTPVGTAGYAAPEQARGGPTDHRVDVYGLGVTLREALTGQKPEPGVALPPIGSPALAAIVERATRPDPADRYPTMEDLVRALESAVPEARRRPDESERPPAAPLAPACLRPVGHDGALIGVGERCTLGRGSQATVRLRHPTLSRVHAKLVRRRTGEAYAFDLGSTNGVWVEGRRVVASPLPADSLLRIGDLRFRYEEGQHVAAALAGGPAPLRPPAAPDAPAQPSPAPARPPVPRAAPVWPPQDDPDPTPVTVKL
jgi:serine/threonine-protein kinase